MTPKYRVDSSMSLHEGGTKFYQLINIHDTEYGVAIIHHGSYSSKLDMYTPNNSGKSEVIAVGSYDICNTDLIAKSVEKRRRGYKDWTDAEVLLYNNFELISWVETHLKPAQAVEVLSQFGLAWTDLDDPVEEPSPVIEDVVIRPEGWGSW